MPDPPATTVSRAERLALAGVLLVAAVYAVAFIARTSFVIDGRRWFCLFDDVMVSMAYARNLAQGLGAVWVPGELVEGYTNPAWVGLLALVHLLPVGLAHASLVVQVLCAGLWLATAVAAHGLARELGAGPVGRVGAAALTAGYFPLANFALQGNEVALLALVLTVATRRALVAARAGQVDRGLWWLLAAATTVRLDLAIPAVVILTWLAGTDRPRARRHLLGGGGLLLGFLLAQSLARYGYYGQWLPNTYYLKVAGCPLTYRLGHGAWVALSFLISLNLAVALLALAAPRLTRDRRLGLPLAVFLAQLAYSIWVGGDVWEWYGGSNRYLAIAMPLFFVAFALGAAGLAAGLCGRVAARGGTPPPAGLVDVVTALALLFGLLAPNLGRGEEPWRDWLLVNPPLHVADNREHVARGLRIAAITQPTARVAVRWAGALTWFAQRPGVDLLGKCDPVIAHRPMRVNREVPWFLAFQPGHVKLDYGHSIGRLQPDIVAELAWAPEEATPYLAAYERVQYRDLICWARRGSPRVRWDLVTILPPEAPATGASSPRPPR